MVLFKEKWDKNKDKLLRYIMNNEQEKYSTYTDLVKLVFTIIINDEEDYFIIDEITEIDNGSYSGTLLYVMPRNVYEPSIDDYYYTFIEYGSCSVCDTLQAIQNEKYKGLPTEQQIKDYMMLLLQILQNIHPFKRRQ